MKLPTEHSLIFLRAHNWVTTVVEYMLRVPGMKFGRRRDAFGFGDILACHIAGGVMLVQATDRSSVNNHITKVTSDTMEDRHGNVVPNEIRNKLVVWLLANGQFEIWGWAKGGPRGQAKRWRFRRIVFSYTDGHLVWEDKEME